MRILRILAVALSASAIVSLAAATAQTPVVLSQIDRVEEDWELVVKTPNLTTVGPQVTTCMSPVSNGSTPFVAFDVNYREFPSFEAGGLQLQVWSGKTVLSTSTLGTNQFETADETVTWTQSMKIFNGTIAYDILNGRSTTFGRFGQGYGMLNVSYPTTLTDLSLTYSPDLSANRSGVSWQANLVASMRLVQVRYYKNGLLFATDSIPRSVALGHD
jgi:hypothetical protein